MKQKIVVTDACVFIDLFELGIIADFFTLDLEVHSTENVLFELNDEQQKTIQSFMLAGKISIYSLTSEELLELSKVYISKSMTIADKTVLHLASRLSAIVISSDRLVRSHAKQFGLSYHGLIWVIELMITKSVLNFEKASACIEFMLSNPNAFRINEEMHTAILRIKSKYKL